MACIGNTDRGAGSRGFVPGAVARQRRQREAPMQFVRKVAVAGMLAVGLVGPAGAAGNLTTGATTIKIDMTPDKKFSTTAIEMETGKAYNLDITQLGTTELQFHAPDLFGNSYIFQVVVDGKEIKTAGVRFLEFDESG